MRKQTSLSSVGGLHIQSRSCGVRGAMVCMVLTPVITGCRKMVCDEISDF